MELATAHALRIGPGPATTGPHTPAVTCTQPSHTRKEGFRHEASVHGWQREWGSRSLQVARRRLRHPAPQLFRVLTSNDQETNFSWGSHPSSKLHPQRPHQSADRRSQHTACAAAVGSTPALCGEFERNAAYYTYPGSATGSSALRARVTSMPHNATNATRRAGHNASGRGGVEAPQGAGAGGGRPIDYQRIIKLFVNKHTEGLVDRQVSAIQRLVRKNQEGYVVWRFSQHGGCPLSAAARCLSPVHACWNHVLTASTWFRLPRLQVLHQGPTSHRGAVALGVWSCRSWC